MAQFLHIRDPQGTEHYINVEQIVGVSQVDGHYTEIKITAGNPIMTGTALNQIIANLRGAGIGII